MRIVHKDGFSTSDAVNKRGNGARPALMLSSIDRIPTNVESGKRTRNEILEVEYGYYPQKAVARDMQIVLEQEFKNNRLNKTGNSYTTDSRKYNAYDKRFAPKQHKEYEYNGKRYVRVKANSSLNVAQFILSNGEKYRNGDNVWVEVLPVKWLVDEKAKMMITEKIIFAGVQFNRKVNYHTEDFENTDINRFMVTYFAPEIIQILKEQQLANVNNKSTEDEGR